jgi:FlaA1/EpsC-like NDP-sugar epimerase
MRSLLKDFCHILFLLILATTIKTPWLFIPAIGLIVVDVWITVAVSRAIHRVTEQSDLQEIYNALTRNIVSNLSLVILAKLSSISVIIAEIIGICILVINYNPSLIGG